MSITEIIEVIVYDYMWGTPMIIFILAAGLYFTFRSGLFQFRFFGHAIKTVVKRLLKGGDRAGEGTFSPMQALSTALGSTVGTGNIRGVATAVAVGGPGAVFWLWVAGLFGMLTKMVEITLAVYYRRKDAEGNPYGGPTYYMEDGIGKKLHMPKVAWTLIILFFIGFFMGFFINIQTYTVTEAVSTTFGWGMIPVAVIYTIILFIMISGGLKRVGDWCSVMVPIMCVFYLVGGLFIIIKNIDVLPAVIESIFVNAFTPTAAFGGFAGASVSLAMTTGFARSVYSNEAGWGTSPMIHASARVDHPIKEGLVGVFEVFTSTFIICTITALVVLVTGMWSTGIDGANLTLTAFESELGMFGRIVIAVSVFLFGITTASGIYVQSEAIFNHVIKNPKAVKIVITAYKFLYPMVALIMVFIAVYNGLPGATIWLFADASTALPILTNTATLIVLFPVFLKLLNDYKARYMNRGKVDPDMKVFYNEDSKVSEQEAKGEQQ